MILFITRKYPPSVGGMQNLSYRLTRGVSEQTAARIISWGGSQRWLPFFVVWALVRSVATLVGNRVTLVHIGDPVLAPLGNILRILGRMPVVVNAHGLDITYRNPLYQALIPACLRHLDRVICISKYTRDQCIQRGVPAARCAVIPLGIDVADYVTALPEGRRAAWLHSLGIDRPVQHILLTVGRLVPRKGLAPFVSEALPRLAAQRRDWVYLLIGTGPEREAIEAAVQAKGLSECVKLLGHAGNDVLRQAYGLAGLFVMPNVPVAGNPEGFGLVTLEARAAGVPVVAADLEGLGEAITHQDDGTLVQPGDWPTFVAAINSWLDRKETAADRERRRERTRETFSWSRIITRYMAVFQEVEAEHRARTRSQDANRH